MLRPVRLLFLALTLTLVSGGAALRFAAPAPAGAFGMEDGGDAQQVSRSIQFYALLWSLANSFGRAGPDQGYPAVGRPGFSESEMGRGLADLRSRQTGVPNRPRDYSDMVGDVQRNIRSMEVGMVGNARRGPPKAQRKSIRLGE